MKEHGQKTDAAGRRRYLAVFGFNTKQWWVWDEADCVLIDPPIVVLNELDGCSDDDGLKLEEIANASPSPLWLFDQDHRYDKETEI